MQPPNLQVLRERIRRVQAAGMIKNEIAEQLIEKNQANEDNRKGMIWFCFFDPRVEVSRESNASFVTGAAKPFTAPTNTI